MSKPVESIRERCRKLFRLTALQLGFAWRQVTEVGEPQTTSYSKTLAELGRSSKSPEVQASNMVRLPKVVAAMSWLREELGILAREKSEETSAALRRAKILRLLESHADGNLDDVFPEDLELRWEVMPREVKALVKKVKKIPIVEKGEVVGYREEVELHDPQKAADLINRMDGNYKTETDPALLALLERLRPLAAEEKAEREGKP